MLRYFICCLIGLALHAPPGSARADPMLKDFAYPHPVRQFEFASQNQPLVMAYMDVAPQGPANGETVVLLHGKNFCGATWEKTIAVLSGAGYRVIAPDQIGFCKSSKPERYQYGLHQLAANTSALLKHAGVKNPIVMGHSMGGMLAFRYALMYGGETRALVAVNPIGLEDWKAKGVPAVTVDALYQSEQKTSRESIKKYQLDTYYSGVWRNDYDRWVDMLAGMYAGEDGKTVAWSQALTSDMIFMQPVVYEFGQIAVPALLLIGAKDTTAIGKNRAPAEAKKTLGDYRELGPQTAGAVPGAKLVMFPELGHSPQVEAPDEFHKALLDNLKTALAAGVK